MPSIFHSPSLVPQPQGPPFQGQMWTQWLRSLCISLSASYGLLPTASRLLRPFSHHLPQLVPPLHLCPQQRTHDSTGPWCCTWEKDQQISRLWHKVVLYRNITISVFRYFSTNVVSCNYCEGTFWLQQTTHHNVQDLQYICSNEKLTHHT